MRLPNIFIVGFPKSGTTAMSDLLGQHPDIYTCPVKEPNYFCTDIIAESDRHHGGELFYKVRDERSYADLFRTEKPFAIDASVTYIFSEVAAGLVHAFNPEAKIVIMLRNPVEMIESMYHHNVRTLDETASTITEALGFEEGRKSGEDVPKRTRFPSMLHYTDWTNYAGCITRYTGLFGDNVKLVIFDDFKEQQDTVLRDVCAFLGINDEFEAELHNQNPRKKARFVGLYSIFQNPGMKKVARSIMPMGLYHKIKDGIFAVFLKEYKKTPIPDKVAADIRQRTHANVVAFQEWYNSHHETPRDFLKMWGYIHPVTSDNNPT